MTSELLQAFKIVLSAAHEKRFLLERIMLPDSSTLVEISILKEALRKIENHYEELKNAPSQEQT